MTSSLRQVSTANNRASALLAALRSTTVIADGAMGTMLQAADLNPADFDGVEGCNEMLNVTRPDVVAAIHDAYLEVGVDAIKTNTFGVNWSNLADYGIESRIFELALSGAQIARMRADAYALQVNDGRPRWVLGSMGPGTKLPSLGHTTYAHLKDTFTTAAAGLLAGGVDAVLIETSQDLLQAKAAINGIRAAFASAGRKVPILVSVTIETTGTMLVGSDIAAALVSLQSLGVEAIGLNCATGPDLMTEPLRFLAAHSPVPITCMPNAGMPELTPAGAHYPLSPAELAAAHAGFIAEFGVGVSGIGLVGGCCGTTPEHLAAVVKILGYGPDTGVAVGVESPGALAESDSTSAPTQLLKSRLNAVASLYSAVDLSQDLTYLAIGERTNANGSLAFRKAMLENRWNDIVAIANEQAADGAHLLDVCVDYVGRDSAADMREVISRLATSSTLPLMIDSTEPDVLRAGLELLGGRAVVNSVNLEDGDGPDSRLARTMALVKEHGAAVVALTIDEHGQARTTADKVRVATRLIEILTTRWRMRIDDIIVDTLTFPIATGQDETRRDAIETIQAIRELTERFPGIHTTLGVSNVSFGLSPAARVVLNSVFLAEAVAAGLDSAIVHSARILPRAAIGEERWQAALDLIWDRREFNAAGVVIRDPLSEFMALFEGVDAAGLRAARESELSILPPDERLFSRVVDGVKAGLADDVEAALEVGISANAILNEHLLPAMAEVGRRFGAGKTQLPFVLQSAEVMKAAVGLLEPHLAAQSDSSEGPKIGTRGTLVLATVRGDVHDIGKNLVDIILSNNGYRVINLGIKQPIGAIIDAALEHDADVIGMSGLLVKSTEMMRENLAELTARGLARRWPVMLGGAALTRTFVEQDLQSQFDGVVRYAKDAFAGLAMMDELVAIARTGRAETDIGEGEPATGVETPGALAESDSAHFVLESDSLAHPADSTSCTVAASIPAPPFWGTRIVTGISLEDYAQYLNERALFAGSWGLKPGRSGKSYAELVETEGRPRLERWLERIVAEQILEPQVVYGYFRTWSDGNDVVVLNDNANEQLRFTFPRQTRDQRLCLADWIRPRAEVESDGQPDVLPIQLVTVGARLAKVTGELFAAGEFREYHELHGLAMNLTEALSEWAHAHIRSELGIERPRPADESPAPKAKYRGERVSLGYPTCPNLEDRSKVVELLRPERIGVTLSDEFQLHPEASTDALVFHHPEARYFSLRSSTPSLP